MRYLWNLTLALALLMARPAASRSSLEEHQHVCGTQAPPLSKSTSRHRQLSAPRRAVARLSGGGERVARHKLASIGMPVNAWQEFCHSFILALAVACSTSGEMSSRHVQLAACHASMFIGLQFAHGSVSKSAFNPAVSLVLVVRGEMAIEEALGLSLIQVTATALAGVVCWLIHGALKYPTVANPDHAMGWLQGYLSEVFLTCSIVSVLFSARRRSEDEASDRPHIATGLVLFASIVGSGPISGGVFNPALGLGLLISKALLGGEFPIRLAALYTVGPLVGALLALGTSVIPVGETEALIPPSGSSLILSPPSADSRPAPSLESSTSSIVSPEGA
jgi:aquaporin Z